MTLPDALYSVSQLRQLEAAAIAAGTTGYTLMTRAGQAALLCLRGRWPAARRLLVVCGGGNNGGDGMVLARLAAQQGMAVTVALLGNVPNRGEAAQAYADLCADGMVVRPFDPALTADADVVVDALLGIGVRAPLHPAWQAAITALNTCGRPILALDLPSGLDPDSGHALPAVRATVTLGFIALKQGLLLRDGPEHAGEIELDAIGVTRPAASELTPALYRMTSHSLVNALPPRARQSHKSAFGRVVIVGGGRGMPGAVRLAAEAALRIGAGLVTVASLPEHLACVVGARPELMFHALHSGADVAPAVSEADVIVVGPGLGQTEWARSVFASVLDARQPHQQLVIDADGLNLIAAVSERIHRADWVLTPHPGEAARLLGCSTALVQQDRLGALRTLCAERGGTIVLKGAGTLVGQQGAVPRLCDRGNAGMSIPGMGDVLTGAIAGILAQGAPPLEAAVAGVYAHAAAGDRCARDGIRGMLSLEVAQALRAVLAHLP